MIPRKTSTDEPIEQYHAFSLLSLVQLAAISLRGLDRVVRIGLIEVEACAGCGELAKEGIQTIVSLWVHVKAAVESLRAVSADRNNTSEQLSLWRYRRSFATIDKLTKD